MKKALSFLTAAVLMVSGGLTAASETVNSDMTTLYESSGDVSINASETISNWTPILTTSQYGAKITLNNFYTGSVIVELWDTSGKTTSFSQNFSNTNIVTAYTPRTLKGTYKIKISVTINGGTTNRESSYIDVK